MSAIAPMEVIVVGGGASGVLVSARLLDASITRPVRVRIIEQSDRPAAGVAYGTDDPGHLLNVRAGGMSADPSHPDDFADWAAARQFGGASSFVARRHYRDYLQDHLRVAANAATAGRVDIVHDTAVGIVPSAGGVDVLLTSGSRLRGDTVVLALGNPPPGTPPQLRSVIGHPRWIGNPWAPRALDRIPPTAQVVLVGSGLTMIDVAITIGRQGGTRMLALSRHGILPNSHLSGRPPQPLDIIDPGRDAGDLLALVRRIRSWSASGLDGTDWRDVIDSVRPSVNALWQRSSPTDRTAFLTHLARYWDVHRHRMAPETGARLQALTEHHQLRVHAGRILAAESIGDHIELTATVDGHEQRLRPDLVVNCTGPGRSWEPPANPVVTDLISRGIAVPDPLRLGLSTTADGHLLDRTGATVDRVLVIGPPRRGSLLETTAIPELRSQALHIADEVVVGRGPGW